MNTTTQWNVSELLSTSSAYWRGCTLQAAVRLDIFTALDENFVNACDLSRICETDERGLELLLNALTAMGLLKKDKQQYSNTNESCMYLSKKSKQYMGYIILHHHHILDGWAQLHEAVITGSPVKTRSYGVEDERESFLMGMFNLAMGIAPKLASFLNLEGRKRLLDLGGGPGTYAIHFCKENPGLHAVIYDRETTKYFADKTVAQFGLSSKIGFAGGDFTCDAITGGPFDVAWLSHILHSNDFDECQKIINKTVKAMDAGGLILIHDFILDNSKASPEFPALFALNMLLNNPGRTYSVEEITGMLENAGVENVKRHSYTGPNDAAIICGTVK